MRHILLMLTVVSMVLGMTMLSWGDEGKVPSSSAFAYADKAHSGKTMIAAKDSGAAVAPAEKKKPRVRSRSKKKKRRYSRSRRAPKGSGWWGGRYWGELYGYPRDIGYGYQFAHPRSWGLPRRSVR